ncbi:MAG: Na+/H+ antiporter subunit B [Chthoniobacterales bacterium]
MNSIILATVSRLLTGLLLVFSVFLLLRGHNLPGGGFAGGLVAASAFVLHALATDFASARRLLGFDPRTIMGLGLAVAIASGLLAFFKNKPFLTGLWDQTPVPLLGKLGTPLLFDTGVYLLVLGMTCLVVFTLGEDD